MKSIIAAKAQMNETDYDFYTCYDCGRLITRIEEIAAFTPGSRNEGKICPCGCRKYKPANLRWYHWFLPRVLRFACLRVRGIA